MYKFLKEIQEKTKTKLEEINKSILKSEEKPIERKKKSVQDLSMEIEAMKKTKTGGILEMEVLGKQRGSIGRNITNTIQEGISGFEDIIDKIDTCCQRVLSCLVPTVVKSQRNHTEVYISF